MDGSYCVNGKPLVKKTEGAFFWENPKQICDLGSMDSSASKNRKIRKRIIFYDNANKQTKSCVQLKKKHLAVN